MKVALISPYEIGRQPFALAEPAAWLKQDGFDVECVDLANEPFDETRFRGARLIAIHLIMHAGARLAAAIIPKLRETLPQTPVCVYGLYAPVNDAYFRSLGCEFVFGGEAEADLLSLCRAMRDELTTGEFRKTRNSLDKLEFVVPDRSGLPALTDYSSLTLINGTNKTVGFAEASRGCKHLCRHCPVVPVYSGQFRVIPVDIVMKDIRQQIEAGAEHISFGDPDFLNGPGHARRIIERFNAELSGITWDATIKIEHLLKHEKSLKHFADSGCLFITSAVESIEDHVLARLEKGHTANDFYRALTILRQLGIAMQPTFVPFTPWTTIEGYLQLLKEIVRLRLVNCVTPVQFSIRLLLPQGSRLLELEDRSEWLGEFDSAMLGYQWKHRDRQVDELQARVQDWVMEADERNLERQDTFAGIWDLAYGMDGATPPKLIQGEQPLAPQMSEPWYCCSEPTDFQKSRLDVEPPATRIQGKELISSIP